MLKSLLHISREFFGLLQNSFITSLNSFLCLFSIYVINSEYLESSTREERRAERSSCLASSSLVTDTETPHDTGQEIWRRPQRETY